MGSWEGGGDLLHDGRDYVGTIIHGHVQYFEMGSRWRDYVTNMNNQSLFKYYFRKGLYSDYCRESLYSSTIVEKSELYII